MTSSFSLSGIADQTAVLSAHLEFGWAAQYSRCTFKAKLQPWSEQQTGVPQNGAETLLFEVLKRPITKAKFCPHLGRRISKPDG
jgi:hypothetical protein